MELKDYYNLKRELAPLLPSGWSIAQNDRKSSAGVCKYRLKVVEINKYHIVTGTDEEVRNTMLHEIAHAHTEGANHGFEWKKKVLELGGTPERCTTDEVAQRMSFVMSPKYVLWCSECKAEFPSHRRRKRNVACVHCCNEHAGGRYDERFLLTQEEVRQ